MDTITVRPTRRTDDTHDYSTEETCDSASMPRLEYLTDGDPSRFTPVSDDESLPLDLSQPGGKCNREVSNLTPRATVPHHGVVQGEGRRSQNTGVELPRYRPPYQTSAQHSQKLIVREKVYSIISIGYGLWVLNDNCEF